MKLFSRGQNAAVGPASTQAVAPPVEEKQEAPAAQPAPQPPSEVAELLESSVKDISEKVARLASTVETTGSEREAFEAKLSQMEDRMRKLSSLTEMISAQYNPFVGDAPSEREPMPAPEAGLASPPAPKPARAAEPAALAELEFAPDAFELSAPEPEFEVADEAAAVESFEPEASFEPPAPAPAEARPRRQSEPLESIRIEKFGDDFQSSMVLLKWADLMLQNTQSREKVGDLVEYYHNIGWIGDIARDQLLAYAEGIAFDDAPADQSEWRASAEFHEVSLLFLEKLRARGQTP